MHGGKGFGGGEATRDPGPTYYDPNDPKGKQQAIHKAESFAEYLAKRGGGGGKAAPAPAPAARGAPAPAANAAAPAATHGGKGFGAFKEVLVEALVAHLSPIQAEMARLLADPAALDAALRLGATRAAEIADPIVTEAEQIVGFLPR
jgi:hypothetical protein